MSDIRKILFVTGQLECGGLERQLFNLAGILRKTGIQIKVACFNAHPDFYSARLRALGVEVEFLPSRLSRVTRLRRLAREWKPEVVHSFSNFTNFPMWLAIAGLPTTGFGSWRSGYRARVSGYGRLRFWLNTHWPQTIVVNSRRALKEAQEGMPERSKHFVVVENGIDLNEFHMQAPPAGPAYELLGIGALTRLKRWDRALRVVRLLKEKGLAVNLSIAGDGSMRGDLERLARELRIEKSVRFLGLIEDVARLIARHHCVIHTAETEGSPNAALEALACGRPVVAMNAGDIEWILRSQKGECLIRQGDESGMAEEIERLIGAPQSLERIGRANRAWMEENYSIEHSARRMLAVYEETRRRLGRGSSSTSVHIPGSLRVLHVVPAAPNGGTNTYTQREIDRLGRSGVDSRVVFFAGSSMLRRPHQILGEIRAIRREIRAFRPHVVHAHWGSLLALASAIATIGGPPLVIGYHGSDINPVPAEAPVRTIFRVACSQLAALGADAIICVSEELRGRLWAGRGRARVILSGTNLDRFLPCERVEARRRLQWPADEPVVLFNAGMGRRVKRLDLAEASIAHARRSLGRLRFEVMRGDVPCDEVPDRLNAADCLLVTSDFEGSPNIVREALACSTPVVSVPVGDVRKWLDGLAGTRVVERDPVLLGQAIVDAITSGIRPALDGRTAKFSDLSSCRAVLEVYESLVMRDIRC